jgi:hypothetical protein
MNASTPLRVSSRTLGSRRPGTVLTAEDVQQLADAGRLDDLIQRKILVPADQPARDVAIVREKPRRRPKKDIDGYREVGKPDLVTDETELIPLEDVAFDEENA